MTVPSGHTSFSWLGQEEEAIPHGHTAFSWRGAEASRASTPTQKREGTGHPFLPSGHVGRRGSDSSASSTTKQPAESFSRWPHDPSPSASRFCAMCAYDGTPFPGWMGAALSVSRVLEGRLSRLLRRGVQVVGAGRTDAGVHARGMAFHFDAEAGPLASLIPSALSRGLPQALQAEC